MSKGSRREREAVELLKRAGYATYRPATVRFGENDMWGLFDVLAIAPDMPPRAIQVKSNRAVGIRSWSRHTALWRTHGFVTEYWVPVDNQGWRVIECTDAGHHTTVDERDETGVFGDRVVEYLQSESGVKVKS